MGSECPIILLTDLIIINNVCSKQEIIDSNKVHTFKFAKLNSKLPQDVFNQLLKFIHGQREAKIGNGKAKID